MLDALDAEELSASTVVVFFSDHGFALGERGAWGKRSLFENDARVPFIVADPRYTAGQLVSQSVSLSSAGSQSGSD